MTDTIWLSDLHLDAVKEEYRLRFYHRLRKTPGERVVISGDISDGRNLSLHLSELAESVAPRPVYFVLGNHDFYGSSFQEVHRLLEVRCKKHSNLHHLGHGEIVSLGANEALVGHGGWSDGRAGHGVKSKVRNPDFWSIKDFQGMSRAACYQKIRRLGQESGMYLRQILPYTLTCYRQVWVATHFPTFTQAAWWNGKLCNYDFQPHYTNLSMGYALWAMSSAFPKSKMTVLAGHTHSAVCISIKENLAIHTAGASPGYPSYQVPSVDLAASTGASKT
jgi:UDP-2,3-diacylglucosamine pyrophosphatase LpxH